MLGSYLGAAKNGVNPVNPQSSDFGVPYIRTDPFGLCICGVCLPNRYLHRLMGRSKMQAVPDGWSF